MADFNYQKTLEDIGNKLVDLTNDTIKVALCTAGYTAVEATDHKQYKNFPFSRLWGRTCRMGLE